MLLFSLGFLVAPLMSAQITGYAWTPVSPGHENIVNFYWVQPWNVRDIPAAVDAMNAMPEGRRAMIISGNVYATEYDEVVQEYGVPVLHRHPADRCRDAGQTPLNFQCIWWDQGAAQVRDFMRRFFEDFQEAGGQVDVIVLDTEKGMSNWAISTQAHWDAIENDPRFQSTGIRSRLTALGPFGPANGSLYQTVGSFGLWCAFGAVCRDNYLIWNSLMHERTAEYINQAVYEPASASFPNVRMSDFGFYHWSAATAIQDFHGHHSQRYGLGAIVGTHQSEVFYAAIGQIASSGLAHFQPTPYNAFRYDVNRGRAATLSSPKPTQPWMAPRSWWGDVAFNHLVRNSDLHQEILFHAGMTGTTEFLYWNPSGNGAVDDQNFGAALKELQEMTEGAARQPLQTGLSPWQEAFVYSGIRTGASKVWRFTPEIAEGQSLAGMVVNDRFPAVFQVGPKQIVFAQGRIHRPSASASAQGHWIVQPATAPDPVVLDCPSVDSPGCWALPAAKGAITRAYTFPNPSRGADGQKLRVVLSGKAVSGKARLYSLSGEKVAELELGEATPRRDGSWEFELAALQPPASGVYVFQVEATGVNGDRWTTRGKTAVVR